MKDIVVIELMVLTLSAHMTSKSVIWFHEPLVESTYLPWSENGLEFIPSQKLPTCKRFPKLFKNNNNDNNNKTFMFRRTYGRGVEGFSGVG